MTERSQGMGRKDDDIGNWHFISERKRVRSEGRRRRYLLTGIWERRRGLIKVLWVYLGSDMNELFTAPTLPSVCVVCNASGRRASEEVTFDCFRQRCRAIVVTARSELFKFKMKPGRFNFPSILLRSTLSFALFLLIYFIFISLFLSFLTPFQCLPLYSFVHNFFPYFIRIPFSLSFSFPSAFHVLSSLPPFNCLFFVYFVPLLLLYFLIHLLPSFSVVANPQNTTLQIIIYSVGNMFFSRLCW